MVYDSDFYTTRRVGSTYTRPTISSYTVTRRGVDWEKVPFVPRPSLIPDPVTAFGKSQPRRQQRVSILETINREGIEPDPRVLARPIDEYLSPRDRNRTRILNESVRQEHVRATGHASDRDNMDTVLRRVHGEAPIKHQQRHTPRYSTYTTTDIGTPRRDESYTYSKTVRSETSSAGSNPYSSRPSTSTSNYSSTTERSSRGGPGGYSYNTERTTTTGSGPGGYSYSSTTSGRLPHGTTYRHYSYRV